MVQSSKKDSDLASDIAYETPKSLHFAPSDSNLKLLGLHSESRFTTSPAGCRQSGLPGRSNYSPARSPSLRARLTTRAVSLDSRTLLKSGAAPPARTSSAMSGAEDAHKLNGLTQSETYYLNGSSRTPTPGRGGDVADGGRVRWESSETDLAQTPATEQVRLYRELFTLMSRQTDPLRVRSRTSSTYRRCFRPSPPTRVLVLLLFALPTPTRMQIVIARYSLRKTGIT